MTFFPPTFLQHIIERTDGVEVVYKGQKALFHCEEPTFERITRTFGDVQGVGLILIGDAGVFPDLEENKLISVDGDDFLVGQWRTPDDGGVIYIALKTSVRT